MLSNYLYKLLGDTIFWWSCYIHTGKLGEWLGSFMTYSSWQYEWAGYGRVAQEEIIEEYEVLQAELLQVLRILEANQVFFKITEQRITQRKFSITFTLMCRVRHQKKISCKCPLLCHIHGWLFAEALCLLHAWKNLKSLQRMESRSRKPN